jgi:hypothetical protein
MVNFIFISTIFILAKDLHFSLKSVAEESFIHEAYNILNPQRILLMLIMTLKKQRTQEAEAEG